MKQSTMRAVICHGYGRQHRFDPAVPIPAIGPGEVLVRVDAAGVCAADRMMYAGTAPWDIEFPFIPGHEFTGTVVDLGEGAAELHELSLGDRTVAELDVTTGEDYYTRRGLYHLTNRMKVFGSSLDGAWAEYLRYPAQAVVHRVPDTVSTAAACYTEPLANAIHGVERATIEFSHVVVVSGGGAIGMGMLQAARLKTPRQLILIDPNQAKRELGRTLGADSSFHPDDPDLRTAVLDLTDGRGCDVYLEAAGATASFQVGLELIRKRGTLVVFGVYAEPATVDLNTFGEFKELDVRGGHLAPFTYAIALDLMSRGLIDGDACVTHEYPLEEFIDALEPAAGDGPPRVKAVLRPGS
ncbi:MAG: alcohol dehydrogenase catalytic domain-containing protein [Actinomycetota bacterium]